MTWHWFMTDNVISSVWILCGIPFMAWQWFVCLQSKIFSLGFSLWCLQWHVCRGHHSDSSGLWLALCFVGVYVKELPMNTRIILLFCMTAIKKWDFGTTILIFLRKFIDTTTILHNIKFRILVPTCPNVTTAVKALIQKCLHFRNNRSWIQIISKKK